MVQQRLYRNMYVGGPFAEPSTRFGLVNGQVRREHVVVRDALWYGRKGEYLGQGDLSRHDFWEILHGLERGELFAACEAPPVWSPREEGIHNLRGSCRYIVQGGGLFVVEEQGVFPVGTRRIIEGVLFQVISRNGVYDIITIA